MDELLGRTDPRRGLNPTPTAAQSALAESTRNALHFKDFDTAALGLGLQTVLREGSVSKTGARALVKRTTTRHLVLFNDALVIADDKAEKGGRRSVKQLLPLRELIAVMSGGYAAVEALAGADDHGRALDPRLGFV